MSTVRILHTADLHLDSPFDALAPEKAAARREELRELPGKIARVAVKEKVDILLLAGDILDSESFFRETGEELFRVLRNLPLPVFIAPGNHDFYSSRSPYARADLPSNVYVFTKNEIEFFDFSDQGFRVFGAAFTDRSSGPVLKRFKTAGNDGVLNIMCLHGEAVSGGTELSDKKYNPVTLQQISDSGMDYVALGHIHKASGLLKAGDVWYSWPGCPEGRGFDETGEKTVSIIELSGGEGQAASCSLHTVPVSLRKYEILDVDLTDKDPLLAIQMELPDETVRDIYKIVLHGETDTPVKLRGLYENLSQYFFELTISDATRIGRDIWDRAGDDTLRGLFLSKMRRQYDAAEDEAARMQIEQSVRWGLAALDNREEVVRHENN